MDDHNRPLNNRGLAAAPLMGAQLASLLAERRQKLDLILSSSAKRACQTSALVRPELHNSPEERILHELYLCGPEGVLAEIRKIEDRVDSLLVVSHNPDLQILTTLLAAGGDDSMRAEATAHFPTGCLAGLEFDCRHWREVGPGRGRIFAFATPKGLAS